MMKKRVMVPAERIAKIEAMLEQFPKEVAALLKGLHAEFKALSIESVIVERRDADQSDEAKRRRAMERKRLSRARGKVG